METQRVTRVDFEPSVAFILIPAIVLDADTHKPVFVEVEQHTRQVELAVTFECLLYEEVDGLLVYFSVSCVAVRSADAKDSFVSVVSVVPVVSLLTWTPHGCETLVATAGESGASDRGDRSAASDGGECC